MTRQTGLAVALKGVAITALLTQACVAASVSVTSADFGKTPQGDSIKQYTLTNENGMSVSIISYGGIIQSVKVPTGEGKTEDMVLGYDDLSGYVSDTNFYGALIGRYGNRIAKGKFTLNGESFELETNNNENHLHGGNKGFHKQVWESSSFKNASEAGVTLTHISPDGAGGYPGELDVTATYTLNNDNELTLTFDATTTKPTPVNLTNHAYFNLAGGGTITDHQLKINAKHFTPVKKGLIPTGELKPVAGTPFDFTEFTAIGERIDADNEQLALGKGYDHNWVVDKSAAGTMQTLAILKDPASGRTLEIESTEPAIQFYSGNFMDGSVTGKGGESYQFRTALCLEPQHFPDSPNQPDFPSTILNPGDDYTSKIVYRFSSNTGK